MSQDDEMLRLKRAYAAKEPGSRERILWALRRVFPVGSSVVTKCVGVSEEDAPVVMVVFTHEARDANPSDLWNDADLGLVARVTAPDSSGLNSVCHHSLSWSPAP